MRLSDVELELGKLHRGTCELGHDVRTIVTAIISEVQMLDEEVESLPAEVRDTVRLLVEDTARLREAVAPALTNEPATKLDP